MDIAIVGAGAAGLMAAKMLAEAGFKVIVLEGRDRIGGRIHTISLTEKERYLEGGAEFIHGNLDVTLNLLEEAGIAKHELNGEMYQVKNGQWNQEDAFFANAEIVIQHLKALKEDISIAEFANQYFSGDQYQSLRESLASYIEGYYSGKTGRISAKAFLKEWLSEDDQQYRPVGGYGKLMDYLKESCLKAGAIIWLSTAVKEIRWKKGSVEIVDERQNKFTVSKALITVPLGVWIAEKTRRSCIRYFPALAEKEEAAKKMGFGSVIKVLLEFEEIFWEEDSIKKTANVETSQVQMFFSKQVIPTWWTQLPERLPVLTGWLSGPQAEKLKDEKDDILLDHALQSLATIFNIDKVVLKKQLRSGRVFNWTRDPFTLGSYSYSTLETSEARKILMEPVQNTLFFAGEALYDGPEMGTVEAALTSGQRVAEEIIVA